MTKTVNVSPYPFILPCRVGETIEVFQPKFPRRQGYFEMVDTFIARKGVVLWVSPAGWALVQMLQVGTDKPIYKECFFVREGANE